MYARMIDFTGFYMRWAFNNKSLESQCSIKWYHCLQLVQVVEEMAGRGKQRLLVLAKRHVRKQWAKHHLDKIHSLAKVFYTEDM